MFSNHRKGKGTKEWSDHSRNIGSGCRNNCRYCYAMYNAIHRWKTKKHGEWEDEKLIQRLYEKEPKKLSGVIMFPTQHDISPFYLKYCIDFLKRILDKGNKVLIVSKPRMDCIMPLCEELTPYKRDQVLFRFSITSLDDEVARFWERGASTPQERIQCLKYAFADGFQTSVSAEPLLPFADTYAAAGEILYAATHNYVTDNIWFGKLNKPKLRIENTGDDVEKEITKLERFQNDNEVFKFYRAMKGVEKIKWKDSIWKLIQQRSRK